MKTTVLKILILVFLIGTISACSSDDDSGSNYTEENFFAGYLAATGFYQEITPIIVSNFNYEQGLEFTPKVKGKITTLKVRIPDANPELRITIWSKATNAVLRTEVVNVASANMEFAFDIADLELVKDNEYAITMNSSDYYIRNRTDGSEATYPITFGNIQINAFKEIMGEFQTYPTSTPLAYYTGDLSFDFLQTE